MSKMGTPTQCPGCNLKIMRDANVMMLEMKTTCATTAPRKSNFSCMIKLLNGKVGDAYAAQRRITARGSAAADSGKTRYASQSETQARRATHTRVEGGRLQPLVGRPKCAIYLLLDIAILIRPSTPIPIAPAVE